MKIIGIATFFIFMIINGSLTARKELKTKQILLRKYLKPIKSNPVMAKLKTFKFNQSKFNLSK